jgi:peptidoglycan/LPS O-acetylase OafA/YrhL
LHLYSNCLIRYPRRVQKFRLGPSFADGTVSPTALRPSTLKYRPAIDGLRALAVLSVFVFHLNHAWLPGGFVGVDVFFVISGYLITSIIFKECLDGSFSLGKFYQRRISRIGPAFFTVGLATLAGAYFIYSPQDLAFAGAKLAAAALSVVNLAFMLDSNYFQANPDSTPYLHYWSLSVEEQFYIFFPLLFLLLFQHDRKRLVPWLCWLCLGSFIGCVWLTPWRPAWAFYLLPTRAFELLAGCLLAVRTANNPPSEPAAHWLPWLSAAGLGLIALSFLVVHEGPGFPGCWPLLAVVGSVAVLAPPGKTRGVGEKFLAARPLVWVGRMSYSLYLWHWPIFSLVDYQLYLAAGPVRLALKIGLSLLAAALSYGLVEHPARVFLNRPANRALAYWFALGMVALCVPLGVAVRQANYVNASFRTVAHGGLVFEARNQTGSVMLLGDSNGSMYGKTLKEICSKLGCQLTVLSVYSGTPLPSHNVSDEQLWLDSLAVVRQEKPDCLILAYRWEAKLGGGDGRACFALAVKTLKPLVGRLIILNQPPLLPVNASRAAIRAGARPPFVEDQRVQAVRLDANDYLRRFQAGNVSVVDVASHFQSTNGEILFFGDQGRQLYHDATHLSACGADLVGPELKQAVLESTHVP